MTLNRDRMGTQQHVVKPARRTTRCKLHAGPDEVFCEHHAYDLALSFEPLHVIGLYGKYFPKQHHPACDRKEQTIATVRTYAGDFDCKGAEEMLRCVSPADS